jgi:hypothetical protein
VSIRPGGVSGEQSDMYIGIGTLLLIIILLIIFLR